MAAPKADPAPVVLVVDDEPILLRLMERALTEAGYLVQGASNGLRALELVGSSPCPPDILVTDLRMEPLNGFDLARNGDCEASSHAGPARQRLMTRTTRSRPGHSCASPSRQRRWSERSSSFSPRACRRVSAG